MQLQRYFIHLAFKGTNYFGWQIQPNHISIQGCLNDALTKINHGKPIMVTGCGRTDTGVHASSFYAHFDFETHLTTEKLLYKLNCMLPLDIAIFSIREVSAELHARFSAISRTYHYHIHDQKNPFITETSFFLRTSLDIDRMNDACNYLLKHTYYKCFSKTISGESSYICTITSARWEKTTNGFKFSISANRFLRNMVRAIVGTLLEVGTGKISLEEFQQILHSENRSDAGKSVPACGLFLAEIIYP